MDINAPYLLFIGDAKEIFSIKLAKSIADWRPELAIGEFAIEGCEVTTSLPRLSIEQAVAVGAKTFVIGLVNSGGTISEQWIPSILQAIIAGMDIVSGLHQPLSSFEDISFYAQKYNAKLIDIRHPTESFKTGTGIKRSGKRLLTVGTDCSAGKMYTSLSIEKEMKRRHMDVQFKATGQCGILIAGEGVAVDCVVADFIAGAVEQLSPDSKADHWDIIEGQGSLLHPAFAGVSLGLLHGAQPDALVMCHVEKRESMRGIKGRSMPTIEETFAINQQLAKLTNSEAKFVGLSINTSALNDSDALTVCQQYQEQFELPVVDPLRHGVDEIINGLMSYE